MALKENKNINLRNLKIADFFTIDLKNIPDETFIEIDKDLNVSGTKVKTFEKKLTYKECGIFDTIEARVIGEGNVNVSFRNHKPNNVNMGKIKELINGIYSLYGADDSNNGKFNNKDISEYNDAQFNMLFGRRWNEYPKYKNPVAIQRDDENVEIAIWSANK